MSAFARRQAPPKSAANGEPALTVTLGACPTVEELEPTWRALELAAAPSFFTSWTWIGGWLQRLEPGRGPRLLRATCGGQVVGLAILVPALSRRLRLLRSPSLHLHATADRRHDDIAVEHNGLLVRRDDAERVVAAMLAHLCASQHGWDQVRFPGLSSVPPLPDHLSARLLARQEVGEAYLVDLASLRGPGGDHLGRLGRNTRSHIKRSIKAYAALGQVQVTAAADIPQALGFLDALKLHHQKTWTARGAPGAFANPLFESFHRQLIARGFAAGEMLMLRVHAADHDIGYLYNFVHQGRVSCYQSGFNYGLLARNHHPGLAVHALAIQHCADLGLGVYDFLAGSERYKLQLATDRYAMVDLSIHRRTPSLRLEEAWWGLKRKLRAIRTQEPSAAGAEPVEDAA